MERDDARKGIAASFEKHNSGDRDASAELVAGVVTMLRRIAREHANDHAAPLSATASLTALYLRGANAALIPIQDHSAFLTVCAAALRLAVVEHMGEDGAPERLSGTDFILKLDAALRVVEGMNARLGRTVECRYFAGLSEEETARALGVDVATVEREWTRARAWALRELAVLSESCGPRAPIPNAAWVDAVFDDALAQSPEELEPFLERCAAAPGDLRASVEELLRFSSAPTPRLEPGDLSTEFLWSVLKAEPAAVTSPSTVVDAVDLVGLPDRPSATVRFLPGASEDVAAFRRRPDWRILSSLDHTGIARLMDVGKTDDGRLFLVWEAVHGRPIDRYCDEERLTIDERLELVLKVCDAVQYAHRKLAVHGAISPSSVVVTGAGEVKLLDFGMAVLLDATAPETSPEDAVTRIQSPGYASPEQVRGEPLAVASDVYQLGLLLYRLLTGETAQVVGGPGTPSELDEVVCDRLPSSPSERIVSADPENPLLRQTGRSALGRALRGDLDAIVMCALSKDPDRRYPSVTLLLSDVKRYARRQPVWARGGGVAYRFRKFVVRRWVPIAAALVFVTAGVAASPAFLGERFGGSGASAEADEVERLIGEAFATPAVRSGAELPKALQIEQAARMARTELAADPARQGRVFTAIGRAYATIGYYERSISLLEEALSLRRTTAGGDSLEVAETLEALGISRHQFGRYDEAEGELRSTIAIRGVRLGAAHSETLTATIALGQLLHSRGRLLESETVLRGAVHGLRSGIMKVAADAPASELLSRALLRLAGVLRDRGVLGEAVILYREAIALLESSPGPHPEIAAAQVDLARALLVRGELDRAEAELAEALPALRRFHPDDHPTIGVALREFGSLRLEQGRLGDARGLLSDALRIQEQWLGRLHPLVPRTRGILAELARRRGEGTEAVELATTALEELERLGLEDHPWTVEIRATLADALIGAGRTEEALRALSPALTSAPRLFVGYDARLARLQATLVRAAKG